MKMSRLFLAATAATLLSTASFAVPPSADAVTVSQDQGGRHSKWHALLPSPEQLAAFRMQIREATRGMTRDQKLAYRKDQFRKIKGMNDAQKDGWRRDLQARWDALPEARKARIEQKAENHVAKRQSARQASAPPQNMNTPR